MKLLYLKINGYKNLKGKTEFDFSKANNFSALIGINGSGKSNVLEAISIIFASLYRNKKVSFWNKGKPFEYEIRYILNSNTIKIKNGDLTITHVGDSEENIVRRDKLPYLPSEIITCYSGDELRIWDDVYFKFYLDYFNNISKGIINDKQNLVFVNKYVWDISLLCLLCHEDSEQFLKSLLKNENLLDVQIKFNIPKNYDKRVEWYQKNQLDGGDAYNEILMLMDIIRKRQAEKTLNFNDIKDITLIQQKENTSTCRRLFYLLFSAGMYKTKKLFDGIDISFNDIKIRQLSEGEKRLILMKCILDILANQNSLVLFDEPDSHLHISRKKELKSILNKDNYYSLLTTHSPSLLNSLEDNQSFILTEKGKGVEVFQSSKFSNLKELTDGAFTLMDGVVAMSTNKDIIIVEGKYDVKYLQKAHSYFKSIDSKYELLNFEFIKSGGTDKETYIEAFNKFKNAVSNQQMLVVLCDDDDPGRNVVDAINNKISKTSTGNLFAIVYPKTDAKLFNGDFLLEDYFDISTYKEIYNQKITKAKTHKDLTAFPSPKNHIQNNYNKFNPEDFKGFKVLFDYLLKEKSKLLSI